MTAQIDPRIGYPTGAPLDNPAWTSLTGVHARFAETHGRAARYQQDVAPFASVADMADPAAWFDQGELAGPGAHVMAAAPLGVPVPSTWEQVFALPGVQMIDTSMHAEVDPDVIELGAADVPEMLDLVARTQPGPFRRRTIELGRYIGIRHEGRLIAMASERLRPPGWTEISAVCTDSEHRGQGIATRLIRDAAAGIRARGETPFLHTAAANTAAIRLYESLGFALRSETFFQQWLTPGHG